VEEYAYVLDFLPQGYMDGKRFRREPIVIALGDTEFKIFELVPKDDAIIQVGDRVFIGKDQDLREMILHVKRRISFSDMTSAAQMEIEYTIEAIVRKEEERFVKFYNEAQPISTRFHMLELLPGLGKKTLWYFVEERKKGVFKDFNDISVRVKSLHHPEKLVIQRILVEVSDPNQKFRLFAAR